MIKMNKKEALKLADLIKSQVNKADEGSDVEIKIEDHDISVMVKSGGGWLNSGFYRSRDGVRIALAEAVEAGKKLKKLMA